jgi:hypothetical protein
LVGFSQNEGADWLEPATMVTMLAVTSRSVRPMRAIWARSTSISSCGARADCWMRASTTPGWR